MSWVRGGHAPLRTYGPVIPPNRPRRRYTRVVYTGFRRGSGKRGHRAYGAGRTGRCPARGCPLRAAFDVSIRRDLQRACRRAKASPQRRKVVDAALADGKGVLRRISFSRCVFAWRRALTFSAGNHLRRRPRPPIGISPRRGPLLCSLSAREPGKVRSTGPDIPIGRRDGEALCLCQRRVRC